MMCRPSGLTHTLQVIRDKKMNKSKGYGIVSFLDGNDFARALKVWLLTVPHAHRFGWAYACLVGKRSCCVLYACCALCVSQCRVPVMSLSIVRSGGCRK